ncbi:hypothetical protein ABW21_db0207563 [Orbilia brochopaga]|nr:hypothetical protein ABW21_db0207563 [Drechslerella brochopaga]
MPVIPFFPNFPSCLNTGIRRRKGRDCQRQYRTLRSITDQGLELLGSTCHSQLSASAPLDAGQYHQQYMQPHPEAPPPPQYTPDQYDAAHYPHSQPASAHQAGGHDGYMLPSLPQTVLAATTGYAQSSLDPALYQPRSQLHATSHYEPLSAIPMYQQSAVVTPTIPSSGANRHHDCSHVAYDTSNYTHGPPLHPDSSPNAYGQQSSNPRTLPPPQPLSAGRVLSTLGAIPPSGLAFFGLSPELQAFYRQRRLPPPPPPQPRVYNFENSTQTTIAETLTTKKQLKGSKSASKSPPAEEMGGEETISADTQVQGIL